MAKDPVYVNEDYNVDITIFKKNSVKIRRIVEYPNLDKLHKWVKGLIKIIPCDGYELIINGEEEFEKRYLNKLFQKDYNKIYYGNIVMINVSK